MLARRDMLKCGSLAALLVASMQVSNAQAQETKTALFKVVTSKDEIIIGLTTDELKALGGTDAAAVAHALAQKGDMAVWQYNVAPRRQWRIAGIPDRQDRPDRQFLAAGRALQHDVRDRAASVRFWKST